MNAFNRFFVGLLSLGWIAALGAAIWLIWEQSRVVDISTSAVALNFDIVANTQAEQILGTIIAGVLMLPALLLLGFEMKPSRRREPAAVATDGDARHLQDRVDTLEKELAEERGRNDAARNRTTVTDEGERRTSGNRRWHLFPRH